MSVLGLVGAAAEVFLPSLCLSCDGPLPGLPLGQGLCCECWSRVVGLAGDHCPRCAGPTSGLGEPCLTCSHEPPPQDGTVAWGEYAGVLRSAVLALKHRGRDELAVPLANRLAGRIGLEPWVASIDQVSFVPSHLLYALRRSHSAAQLLAMAVARSLDLPMRRLLHRRGLARQAGRSRAERKRLPVKSFGPAARRQVRGTILLIDDVLTTGTTLRRAATALLAAGADAVYAAVLAVTPDARRVA